MWPRLLYEILNFQKNRYKQGLLFLLLRRMVIAALGNYLYLLKHFGLVFSSNDQKLTLRLGASRVTFSVCYRLLRSNLFIWFPCPCCYGAWKLLREISKNNNKKWKFHNASTTWCQLHNRNLFDCKDTNRFKTNIFFVIFCAF